MRTYQARKLGLALATLAPLACVGCSTTGNNTATGAGVGAAVGTGAGFALGAITHHPLLGAVAGGLTGAGVGAAVGSNEDAKNQVRQTNAAIATAQAQAQQSRMGMMDVVKMVQDGQSEEVVINQIRATGSSFQLSNSDLSYLKTCNVSDGIIVAMQNARPQPVVVAGPPGYYGPPPVVYAQPVYGPPGVVVVGGGYRRW